jgi:hypothetical protein
MRGKPSGEKSDPHRQRRINPAWNRWPPCRGGGTHKVPVRRPGKGKAGTKPEAEGIAEILTAIKNEAHRPSANGPERFLNHGT